MTLEPAGDNERYRISTNTWSRVAPGTKKKDAAKIAIPATGGAIVGGILGGKKVRPLVPPRAAAEARLSFSRPAARKFVSVAARSCS